MNTGEPKFELPKIKKVGPTEPLIHGELKLDKPNNYIWKTFVDGLGQKLHTMIEGESGVKYLYQVEIQRLTSELLVGFHVSPIVHKVIDGKEVSGSLQQVNNRERLNGKNFKKDFGKEFIEAQAEIEILEMLMSDNDRYTRPDEINSHNIDLYKDGNFSLYDFGFSRYFFYVDYTSNYNFLNKVNNFDPEVAKIMKEKIIFLKDFYISNEGLEHFAKIIKSLKVDFSDMFEIPGRVAKTEDKKREYEKRKETITPSNFYELFMRKIDLLLIELNKKIEN